MSNLGDCGRCVLVVFGELGVGIEVESYVPGSDSRDTDGFWGGHGGGGDRTGGRSGIMAW